jgi:hypothetical protein
MLKGFEYIRRGADVAAKIVQAGERKLLKGVDPTFAGKPGGGAAEGVAEEMESGLALPAGAYGGGEAGEEDAGGLMKERAAEVGSEGDAGAAQSALEQGEVVLFVADDDADVAPRVTFAVQLEDAEGDL